MVPIEAVNRSEHVVVVARTLAADAHHVWALLTDLPRAHLYNPVIERVEMLSPQERGLGAQRTFYTEDGGRWMERVTQWGETGFTVEILESPLPLHHARLKVRVSPLYQDRCQVRLEMHYIVRGGILGRLVDSVTIHAGLHRLLSRTLEGLEQHAQAASALERGSEQMTSWAPAEPFLPPRRSTV